MANSNCLIGQSVLTNTYNLSNTLINCGGVKPEVNPLPKVVTANCNSTSTTYLNKYSLQSNY